MATTIINPFQLLFQFNSNPSLNKLLWDGRISSGTLHLTYSFLDILSFGLPNFYNSGSNPLGSGWNLTSATTLVGTNAQTAISRILAASDPQSFRSSFSDVAKITFGEIPHTGNGLSNMGDITFTAATTSTEYIGEVNPYTYVPAMGPKEEKAAVIFDKDILNESRLDYAMLHEIAHAVGLRHVFEVSSFPDYIQTRKYSVTAYQVGQGIELTNPYTLQLLDILALQARLGSRNYATRGTDDPETEGINEANTVYNLVPWIGREEQQQHFNINLVTPFTYTIWDGAGIDVIDASGYTGSAVLPAQIDLRQERFSSIGSSSSTSPAPVRFDSAAVTGVDPDPGNVAIAYYTVIENAIGTKWDDWLIGNAWDNALFGGGGNDRIYGDGVSYDNAAGYREADDFRAWNLTDNLAPDANGSGNDVLLGGLGDDTLFGGRGVDILHGGFNASDIAALRQDWDSAGQFNNIGGNIAYANDGTDVADYSRLNGVTIKVQMNNYGTGTVTKTDSLTQSQWTDHLFSIERVVGTDGTDVFRAATGSPSAAIEFDGGDGGDSYIFNLATDRGEVKLSDLGTQGIDLVKFENIGSNIAIGYTPSNKISFYETPVAPEDPLVFLLSVEYDLSSFSTFENTEINGQVMRTAELYEWIQQGSWGSGQTVQASSVPGQVYGNGAGYSGGVKPTVDPVSGAFTGMKVNPSVSNYYLDYRYADETLHPWVIKSYASSAGHMSVTFDTYIKDIKMVSGITWEDIRFTVDSSQGNANLTIWIDSLGSSYTIYHFEAGKIINGMGLYGSDMHAYIQNSPNITLNGAGPGQYSASYGWHEDDEEGFQYVGSPMTAHYYLETFSVAGISTINMRTDKLTFKGTAANEALFGLATRDDIIMGFGGNDTLYGYGGNDTLIGGAGRDALYGGAGDDLYVLGRDFSAGGGSNTEAISENAEGGLDTILFTDGIEASEVYMWTDMYGYLWFQVGENAADNTLFVLGPSLGSTGVTTYVERVEFDDETTWDISQGLHIRNTDTGRNLYGTAYGDVIEGGAGSDTLHGYGGNDTLIGHGGNDVLRGGAGNDAYVFARNFSATAAGDIIQENADDGLDTIVFTDGIEASEVYMWTDIYGDLWFQVGENAADNTLLVLGPNVGSTGVTTYVERVEFDDETTWDISQGLHIRNTDTGRSLYGTAYGDVIEGGAGSDTLHGYGGNDTLIGHGGNDVLRGGAGNDAYVFARNFSATAAGDIIQENADDGLDTIVFTDGIEASEIYMWTDNSGFLWMQVGSTATNNTLKTQGSYSSATGITTRIEQVVFDDTTVWDLTEGIHLRNTDTARTFYGTAYGDTLEGGAAADTIWAFAGNDMLIGHGGNDVLRGGDGNDTYVFGYGFSLNATGDRIIETASGGTDTIRFTDSISTAEVFSWTDTSGYLWFQLGTSPASNTLKADGAYSPSTGVTAYVENVAFDDTTIWNLAEGLHLRNNDTGRQMYGSALDDWIEGGAGADTLRGFAGDDILTGRGGNDGLYGGAGADTFVFHSTDVGNGVDTLHDFNAGDGDVIDLRDVLSAYDPLQDDIADFVQFTNAGNHSQVRVDLDGAGTGHGWVHFATVNNHSNIDLNDWVSNGQLLAA